MTDEFNPLENNDNDKSLRNYIKLEIADSNSDIEKSNKFSDNSNNNENGFNSIKEEENSDNDNLNEKNEKSCINKYKKQFSPETNIKKDFTNKIFDIQKVPKLGRSRKTTLRKGKHNKLSQDNLIRKFKVKLINNIYEYINSLFNINNYGKSKTPIYILKKVNPSIGRAISKNENLEWLNTTLKYFFSNNVSVKFSNYSYDYNEKLIKRIYAKKEEKKVISILDKTIMDMLTVYRNNDTYQMYPGFKTLKDDIEIFKKNGEDNQFIQMYTLIAKTFEIRIQSLVPRKRKKK